MQSKDPYSFVTRRLSQIGPQSTYNQTMERKIFWLTLTVLGLVADFILPLWWAVGATIPLVFVSWWVAYRSGWFD